MFFQSNQNIRGFKHILMHFLKFFNLFMFCIIGSYTYHVHISSFSLYFHMYSCLIYNNFWYADIKDNLIIMLKYCTFSCDFSKFGRKWWENFSSWNCVPDVHTSNTVRKLLFYYYFIDLCNNIDHLWKEQKFHHWF